MQPRACSASVLESGSGSLKASHLESVSRRLDPLGAPRLCPHTPGLRGWVQPWQLSGVLPAPWPRPRRPRPRHLSLVPGLSCTCSGDRLSPAGASAHTQPPPAPKKRLCFCCCGSHSVLPGRQPRARSSPGVSGWALCLPRRPLGHQCHPRSVSL